MLVKLLGFLFALLVCSARAAKTDLAGCSLTIVPILTEIVTTTGANGVVGSYGNYEQSTFQWDGTEQCQLLDCGGGRAPPKTDAPGCPGYTGTDTVPSLPFPTASITLNQAAASSPSATPSATPAPAATSSSPLATSTGAPATPTTSTSGSASTSETPSATVSGSGSSAADLNPTATSSKNDVRQLGGRWDGTLLGLAAVAAVLPLV